MEEKLVGKVTHYYGKLGVAVVSLSADAHVGDTLHFKGKNTDFSQELLSMQLEHQAIEAASTGQEIAMKADNKVHEGDEVYLVR